MHCRVIIAYASSVVSISRVMRICRKALVLSSVPTRPHTSTNYTTRQPPYTGTTVITSPTALITGRHVDRCI